MTNVNNATNTHDVFVDRSRRAIAIGATACLLLVGGFGTWAANAKLSGAVVTQGTVVVASDLKAVQHPDGGIVGAINVANGDRVSAGEIVLTLDDALLRANRALVDEQLVALETRLARLTAERDGITDLALSNDVQARKDEPKVANAIAAQRAVMQSRRTALNGEVAALEEQIAQTTQQIDGLEAQRSAKENEVTLIDDELAGLDALYKKGLVPKTRITALRREKTQLLGTSGSLSSDIAVARGRISETQLQKIQLERTFQKDVMAEISAVLPERAQLRERRDAADLQLSRVDVRAPADGVVHELAVHTVGGVVSPGETLMQIVPEADNLIVSASVEPKNINNVAVGQQASVIVSAFDHKTAPRLDGTVTFVSADLKTDANTGLGYYEVHVVLNADAENALAERDLALLPGMPSEVYIATGERTMMDYLTDPLAKQVRSTFREP